MTAKTSKTDALTSQAPTLEYIYKLIKNRAYVNIWHELVAEFRPYFELEMANQKHNDPMRAAKVFEEMMEKRNQDTWPMVAVAYELKLKRDKAASKNRNRWTL